MPLWGHQLLSSNKLLEPLGTLCHRIDHYLYASSFYYNPVGFPLSNLKKKKKSRHPEKEILGLGTNECLGILDPWSMACEWLTVRKICPQRHCREEPFPDFKLWDWEGCPCAWMTSPDGAGMHRCRKQGAPGSSREGMAGIWQRLFWLLVIHPHPQLWGA